MNFKTLFVMIVLLISLGVNVSSTELVFDDETIRISIDLINASGLWEESGTNLQPQTGPDTLDLRIPTLTNCDTIDTDGSGVMSCGSDATGVGEDPTVWKLSNFTGAYEDEIPSCGGGEFTTGDGSDLTCDTPTDTVFDSDTMAIVNVSMFDNKTIIRLGNASWVISTITSEWANLDTDKTDDLDLPALDNNTILRTGNLSDISLYVNLTSNVSLYALLSDLDSYWSIDDTATPSDGDILHISSADQIYDWVAGNPFSWITTSVSTLTNYFTNTEIFGYFQTNNTYVNESATDYADRLNVSQHDWIEAQGYGTGDGDITAIVEDGTTPLTFDGCDTGSCAIGMDDVLTQAEFDAIVINRTLDEISKFINTSGFNYSLYDLSQFNDDLTHTALTIFDYDNITAYMGVENVSLIKVGNISWVITTVTDQWSDLDTDSTDDYTTSDFNIDIAAYDTLFKLGNQTYAQESDLTTDLDDNYLAIETLYSNFKYANITEFLGVENASLLRTGNMSDIKKNVDTNASTACDAGELLDGEGVCVNYNDTIDAKLITTYFTAVKIAVVVGTPQGVIGNLQGYNEESFNVSEVNSDFDLRINFTGITGINQLIYRYRTELGEPHIMHTEVWDYNDNDWEEYAEEGAREHFGIFTYMVLDEDDHIGTGDDEGIVQVRFYTTNPVPSTTHKWEFDWVTIADGLATPSSSESDPFSVHRDGTTPLTGDWDAGTAFTIRIGQINATWNGSYLYTTIADAWNWADNASLINISVTAYIEELNNTQRLWVLAFNYIDNTVSDLVNYFTKSQTFAHIENNITSNNASVNARVYAGEVTGPWTNLVVGNDVLDDQYVLRENASLVQAGNITFVTALLTNANIPNDLTIETTNNLLVGGGFGSDGITLESDGDVWIGGSLFILGNLSSADVSTLIMNGSFMPSVDNMWTLGDKDFRWLSLNVSDIVEAESITTDTVRTTNLQDEDGSNFFEVGCSSSQTLTGLSTTGDDTCSAISITNTQVSDFEAGVILYEVNPTNATITITETQVSDLGDYVVKATQYTDANLTEDYPDLDTDDTDDYDSTDFQTDYDSQHYYTDANASDVVVGGEVSGTISNIVIDSGIHNDEYLDINTLYSNFQYSNITEFFGVENVSLIKVGNTSWVIQIVDDGGYYNAIGDLPTAAVTDGATTTISTGDQIYDFTIAFNYITNAVSDLVNYFTKTEVIAHILNNITSVREDAMNYENITTKWGNIDLNIADDFNWANNLSSLMDNSTINRSIMLDDYYLSGSSASLNSLTLTSALTVQYGGTGTQSFTDGAILFGAGTGEIEVSAQFPSGTILMGVAEGTNPTGVIAFTSHISGTLKHEFGGLEANVASYSNGLYGMISGATEDIDTLSELNIAIGDKTIISTEDLSPYLQNKTDVEFNKINVTDNIIMYKGNKMCMNQNCSSYICTNASNGVLMIVNEKPDEVCI